MTATPLRNSTREWQALDRAHHVHPFTDHEALGREGARIVTRAEGPYIFTSEGHRLLDAFAGLWCVNIGYGRKELAEAAYKQMLDLPYYNTFFKTAMPPTVELSKVLADLAPDGLRHVFYGCSGSDANDTIVQMCRYFWKLKGKPSKKAMISRQYAYHGSTVVGASLSGMSYMHEPADLPLPGFHHVMPPYQFGFGRDLDADAFGRQAAAAVEAKILDLGPDNVAAFIGEPIMGAGGVIIPPMSYWPEIQRICKKHDVLLIADEVICGFGRTGHWFACEYFGIAPDFMTTAKGLTSGYIPLSAVLVSDRVAEVLLAPGVEFNHGYTYSGHPVACAVALENIRILRDEHMIEHVHDDTGPYLAERLKDIAGHPLVGEARSVGFMGAIELVKDQATKAPFAPVGRVGTLCREHCYRLGLVMRATRDTMLLSPPLTWTRAHIDEFAEILSRALDLTQAEAKKL